MDKGFIWSFLGPVCIILAVNTFLISHMTFIYIKRKMLRLIMQPRFPEIRE